MAQATLSVRLDSTDKRYFEEFCKAAGMSISTAITIFVKAVIKNQHIPFEITGDPFHSKYNMEHLRKSIADAEAGKVTPHDLIEVE